MKKLFVQFLFLSITLFSACKKEALVILDEEQSEQLCQAILDEDMEKAEEIFNLLVVDLEPASFSGDRAHEENVNTLIDRLNSSNCLSVSGSCFACGFSLPPFTSINLEIDFNGQQASKVLRFSTPSDDLMVFWSID